MESALGVSSIPSNAPTLRFYQARTPNFLFSTRESVRAHHSSPNRSVSCSSSDQGYWDLISECCYKNIYVKKLICVVTDTRKTVGNPSETQVGATLEPEQLPSTPSTPANDHVSSVNLLNQHTCDVGMGVKIHLKWEIDSNAYNQQDEEMGDSGSDIPYPKMGIKFKMKQKHRRYGTFGGFLASRIVGMQGKLSQR
ncbi:hypothetical protein Syun_017275 [Stephania yunnanensis]|uniref:Uncharacterized protein n=1 Tax=Stephania yunnanensis TaxID=152371 RepID=A0AAP0J8V9_9MAGN